MSNKREARQQQKLALQEERAKKTWNIKDLKPIKPLNERQQQAFEAWRNGQSIALVGSAGTGKTLLAMYFAMTSVLEQEVDQVILIRSIVSSRDPGFLKGDLAEKTAPYENVFRNMLTDLFGRANTYRDMLAEKLVQFETTSFLRGVTYENCTVVIDEAQNLTLDELDTVLTRLGRNSRVLIVGDHTAQDDLKLQRERSGLAEGLRILRKVQEVTQVVFKPGDNVRKGISRSWLLAKEETNANNPSSDTRGGLQAPIQQSSPGGASYFPSGSLPHVEYTLLSTPVLPCPNTV